MTFNIDSPECGGGIYKPHSTARKTSQNTIPNTREICKVPEGEEVVSMCLVEGQVFIATTHYVCRLIDDELVPIKFKEVD